MAVQIGHVRNEKAHTSAIPEMGAKWNGIPPDGAVSRKGENMIVYDRKTGEITSDMTPEQRQKAWEHIVREHVKAHPELLERSEKDESSNVGN